MARPELGTKRLCASCNTKFYDLNKDPITCPKCGALFQPAATMRLRPETAAVAATAAAGRGKVEEVEVPELADAEFVSLEDADAEVEGKKKVPAGDIVDTEEDLDIDEALVEDDDTTFIEDEEEEDEDVSDIIGDVDDEEET